MQSYISDYCANCQICIQNKASHSAKEPLQPYELDDVKLRNIIAFDVATLPWATQEHRYFLVIVDLFSNYLELVAMKDQHATIIKSVILDASVHRHGRLNIAVSDQAQNVDGEIINEIFEQLGIKKRSSSPYDPEGDSQAERSVQTLKTLIRCISAEEGVLKYAWPTTLDKIYLNK